MLLTEMMRHLVRIFSIYVSVLHQSSVNVLLA